MNIKTTSLKRTVGAIGVLVVLSACAQQTAEEKGAEMAGAKIDIVAGVGNALQEKGGRAGESVVVGVGTVFKGVERGTLKVGREIVADRSLQAAGLSITRVQDATAEGGTAHALDAYVIAKVPATGTLRMFVYDALGNEIGRANVQLDLGADVSKYHTFPLESQVKLEMVHKVGFAFSGGSGRPAA